ncbi:MAG: diguanylate cyclase [Candidatus Latescibacterota bacterium]|jgi:diguanylate cyclase (GGDEF)-like protein
MGRILLLSTDEALQRQVRDALAAGGDDLSCQPAEAWDEETRERLAPDLILLDRRARAGDRVLADLPLQPGELPVILLGEYPEEEAWVADLGRGASDALGLPLGPAVLAAKVRVWLAVAERCGQLKVEAVVDELTGVFNRRYLERQWSARMAEAERYRQPISFLLFDLDHFKEVNDTLGHPFGDHVLHEVAGLMQRQVRKEDVLARYGGEEFAVILPHTEPEGMAALAERIRQAVAKAQFEQGGKVRQVTVSAGGSAFPTDGVSTPADLVRCADERLYAAKESGRNQVICR